MKTRHILTALAASTLFLASQAHAGIIGSGGDSGGNKQSIQGGAYGWNQFLIRLGIIGSGGPGNDDNGSRGIIGSGTPDHGGNAVGVGRTPPKDDFLGRFRRGIIGSGNP
ncbi:MAG TPA: hypothetical protein VNL72_01470 [Gammaproteobacteria bacterium]|nr:hypothetical protein [Gammaproteobacteria bacterium]